MYSRLLWQLAVALPFTLAVVVGFTDSKRVFAQLTPDDTLGAESSIVTPQDLQILIEGGALRGDNLDALFHSFEEFNVNSGQQVFFANPASVLNIFTRVTGFNSSNINGVLGVNGAANLFLLNPNGITFGANASLQLNGSFFATTADSFGFEDNKIFSASDRETAPLLTISIPNFLDFRNNAEDIAVNGSYLRVNPRQNISLIGGNTNLNFASIDANGGVVQIAGLSGEGRVNLGSDGFSLSSVDTEIFNSGSITINSSGLFVYNFGAYDSGDVLIRTLETLDIKNGTIDAGTFDVGDAGEVIIEVDGDVTISDTYIYSDVLPGATGEGGIVSITANSLTLDRGTFIGTPTSGSNSNSFDSGNSASQERLEDGQSFDAGDIELNIANSLRIIDDTRLVLSSSGEGNAGNLTIRGKDGQLPNLLIGDGGSISLNSRGTGSAGTITLEAENLTLDSGTITAETSIEDGNTGNINLTIKNLLLLLNRSEISTSGRGLGEGGNINISATLIVAFPDQNSDITSNARGQAGKVTINNAEGVFGFEIRDDDFDSENLEEKDLAQSEIAAFSQQDPTLNGDVIFNIPETNIVQETIEQPEEVADESTFVVGGVCSIGGGSEFIVRGRGGVPYIPGLVTQNSVINIDLVDEVLLPAPPPQAIKPHHRTDVVILNSEGEEIKPAMGAVLLPDGMVEFVDYNPAEVYRDMYAAVGCSR